MTHGELDEWADDHGYQQYRCPGCHKLYHSDSGPVGNCPCGYMSDETDDSDDDNGDDMQCLTCQEQRPDCERCPTCGEPTCGACTAQHQRDESQ